MQLRRLVTLVCAVVGVETAFYAVVAPLLPHYADDLDLSKLSAGVLTAAYPAGVLLGSVPAGILAARLGARRTVLVGLVVVAVASVVFGHARQILALDVTRLAQGIGGSCCWAGGMSWIASEAPPERRGELIGAAMGAAIGGSLFGPVLGALAQATSTALVFTGVGVAMLALAGWAVTMPPDTRPPSAGVQDVRRALADGDVCTAMWLVTLPAIAFGAIAVLAPLRLHALGFGAAAVAAVFLISAALEASESPLVGRFSDRRGRFAPIRVGLAVATLALLAVSLPQTGVLYAVVLLMVTLSLGVFWAPAMAMLSESADTAGVAQGIAFALMNLAWGIGEIAGAGGGGALAKASSDAVVLAVCAVACAGTLALIWGRATRTATA